MGLLERHTLTHIGLAAATVIVTVVERCQMCTHNSNDLQVFLVSAFCHYKFFHNRVGAVGGELRLKYKQKITNVNCSNALLAFNTHTQTDVKKVKVAHSRLPRVGFRSWSWFLAVSLQVMCVINVAVGCHYFPPGLQLPMQPLSGLLPILLLGEQRHNGCEQFA